MFSSEILEIFTKESLRDVMVLGAIGKGKGAIEFSLAEDGPAILQFDQSSLCIRQVRGEEEIDIFLYRRRYTSFDRR